MRCQYCSGEIPQSQVICPQCYASTSEQPGVSKNGGKNVLFFMTNQTLAHLYWSRVTEYLQDRVALHFYADTVEAFREITRNSAGSWDLLIIDDPQLKTGKSLINEFIGNNPQIVLGIIFGFETKLPANSPLRSSILFRPPGDIDGWLLMMHQLLNTCSASPHIL